MSEQTMTPEQLGNEYQVWATKDDERAMIDLLMEIVAVQPRWASFPALVIQALTEYRDRVKPARFPLTGEEPRELLIEIAARQIEV